MADTRPSISLHRTQRQGRACDSDGLCQSHTLQPALLGTKAACDCMGLELSKLAVLLMRAIQFSSRINTMPLQKRAVRTIKLPLSGASSELVPFPQCAMARLVASRLLRTNQAQSGWTLSFLHLSTSTTRSLAHTHLHTHSA